MSSNLPANRPTSDPEDAAHEDGLLMHDVTVINAKLGKYVLRYLDADAKRINPIPIADEHALADDLTTVANSIRTRATRRSQTERPCEVPPRSWRHGL
jgi:hypothetical protein